MIIDLLPPELQRQEIREFPDLTPHQIVQKFETVIADFFGASYCVSIDSCTHALEMCLRLAPPSAPVDLTAWTYMSVPMTLNKLNIDYVLTDTKWKDYYYITDRIIDAAVLWKSKSYIAGTMMTLSFQYKKHCPIGKGGAILLDDKEQYQLLQRLVADGRDRHKLQINDNVPMIGYHYSMTPEDAARGLKIFDFVKNITVEQKGWKNYRDLRTFDCFRHQAE